MKRQTLAQWASSAAVILGVAASVFGMVRHIKAAAFVAAGITLLAIAIGMILEASRVPMPRRLRIPIKGGGSLDVALPIDLDEVHKQIAAMAAKSDGDADKPA